MLALSRTQDGKLKRSPHRESGISETTLWFDCTVQHGAEPNQQPIGVSFMLVNLNEKKKTEQRVRYADTRTISNFQTKKQEIQYFLFVLICPT